ncbi:alpha beta superfamily hydrolase [Fusarium acuminatum]|uniref:Alpha beta superfamily hydrolase n=1 Tax=Fusarium acuminatum TaxID=5515 RepID=A0ABZ2X5T4_9HYPO
MSCSSRRDVSFTTHDGVLLRGWFYQAGENAPAVIITNGWSGTKEQFLDNFAKRFQSAGYGCLVYDNRNFGESDGGPRQHIDPVLQSEDYHDAVTFLSSLDEVDSTRIAAWGSSYSGGNVIQAAAMDKRFKAVIAQVPTVVPRKLTAEALQRLHALQEDRSQMVLDGSRLPKYIPVIADSLENSAPGLTDAFMSTPEAYLFYTRSAKLAPRWENKVTFQSVFKHMKNEPHVFLDKISPTPFLMVVAENDNVTSTSAQIQMFEKAHGPKELHILKGLGHFDVYEGPGFDENIKFQLEFLQKYL